MKIGTHFFDLPLYHTCDQKWSGDAEIQLIKRNGSISSDVIKILAVNRKLLVPDKSRVVTYSAPHMYCSALESVSWVKNSPTYFLKTDVAQDIYHVCYQPFWDPGSLVMELKYRKTQLSAARSTFKVSKMTNEKENQILFYFNLTLIIGIYC